MAGRREQSVPYYPFFLSHLSGPWRMGWKHFLYVLPYLFCACDGQKAAWKEEVTVALQFSVLLPSCLYPALIPSILPSSITPVGRGRRRRKVRRLKEVI